MSTYRLAAFLALACCAKAAISPVRASVQLRVVILAVNEFPESSTFQDDDLDSKMLQAGKELTEYFQQNFSVTPEFLHTRAQTDSGPLRKWLEAYFKTTQQTITLFFVLTHGVGETTNAITAYNSELYLATTDASADTITEKGLKARAELLNYFKSQANGSTVFLFIDACNAARINSEGLKRDLNADPDHHIMILASSQAVENAYQARFTRTLQKLWEMSTSNCTHEDNKIEALIDMGMDTYYPLTTPSTMKQTVRVIRPFTRDFCIESFAADQALLVIGNSSQTKEMKVAYRQFGDTQESGWVPVPTNSIASLTLLRKQYRLHIIPRDATPSDDDPLVSVDLSNGNYAQFLSSNVSSDPIQVSTLGQQAITVAEGSGLRDDAVEMLRSSVTNDLSAAIGGRTEELAQRERLAADAKAKERALLADEQAAASEEERQRQQVEKEEADIATCCRQSSMTGLPMINYPALQDAIQVTAEHRRVLAATGERKSEIAQRRTEAAVLSAQAELASVNFLNGVNQLRSNLQRLENTLQATVRKQQIALQQELVTRIEREGVDVVRTDHGVVFSLDRSGVVLGAGGELPGATRTLLTIVGGSLFNAYPDAFFEVEAYDAGGDQDAAKARSAAVARALTQSLGSGAKIVARGFGRVPVVDQDGKIGQVIPTTVQITVSGPSLGYR